MMAELRADRLAVNADNSYCCLLHSCFSSWMDLIDGQQQLGENETVGG
jgi:hypothetical protein